MKKKNKTSFALTYHPVSVHNSRWRRLHRKIGFCIGMLRITTIQYETRFMRYSVFRYSTSASFTNPSIEFSQTIRFIIPFCSVLVYPVPYLILRTDKLHNMNECITAFVCWWAQDPAKDLLYMNWIQNYLIIICALTNEEACASLCVYVYPGEIDDRTKGS